MKPAEDTVLTAYKLIEILEEAGLPKGVVNFVPGDPKEIGDYLVDSVHTHFVTFTGSRATGTRIYERSAVVQEGQTFLKRVIAEMGGKDAIVVDENIDTDLGRINCNVSIWFLRPKMFCMFTCHRTQFSV